MNATTYFLAVLLLAVLLWEAWAVEWGRLDLTITDTVRSWGAGWAMVLVLATALLFWHLYVGQWLRK